VDVGRIVEVAVLTGFSFKKMYERFAETGDWTVELRSQRTAEHIYKLRSAGVDGLTLESRVGD